MVGKVLATQIPTSLSNTSIITSSTITTTGPITKGIVIRTVGGESGSSKPKPNEEDKGKGKGISSELSKEEKKSALEAEMEKQRHIQSILRQHASDPLGLNKGDPTKLYQYEYIEALTIIGEMHDFAKVPRRSYGTVNSTMNQLDFPVNRMMFFGEQFDIANKYKNKLDYI